MILNTLQIVMMVILNGNEFIHSLIELCLCQKKINRKSRYNTIDLIMKKLMCTEMKKLNRTGEHYHKPVNKQNKQLWWWYNVFHCTSGKVSIIVSLTCDILKQY